MGELINLDEYRQNRLSRQFDTAPKKRKATKQELRERRENELEEEIWHPSMGTPMPKRKEWDDD